jgi:hypothetical protein
MVQELMIVNHAFERSCDHPVLKMLRAVPQWSPENRPMVVRQNPANGFP